MTLSAQEIEHYRSLYPDWDSYSASAKEYIITKTTHLKELGVAVPTKLLAMSAVKIDLDISMTLVVNIKYDAQEGKLRFQVKYDGTESVQNSLHEALRRCYVPERLKVRVHEMINRAERSFAFEP